MPRSLFPGSLGSMAGSPLGNGGKHRLTAALLMMLTGLLAAAPAGLAQEPSRFPRLAALEASADMKAYQQELGNGGSFTDRHRQLLVGDGLTQLVAAGNRSSLAYVRSRLPRLFLDVIGNAAARQQAATAAVEGLDALARGQRTAIEGSVTAALLLGELTEQEGGPLTAATPVLERLVLDPQVVPAVRVAALNGLAFRVRAAGGGSPPATRQAAVALLPTLNKLLGTVQAAAADGLSPMLQEWLRSRSLDLAVAIAPLAETDSEPLSAVGEAALDILKTVEGPVDLRVRAAVLLARLVKPEPASAVIELAELIDAVAVAAVVEDRQARELIELEQSLGGIGPQGGAAMMAGPGGEFLETIPSLLPEATCLRTSWRLVSLADALATIAELQGETGKQLQRRAGQLRELGLAIYEKPNDETVLAAATALAPEPKAAKPAGNNDDPAQPAADGTPAAPNPPTPFSPFQNL